jgi:hypothetical protein
MNVRKDVHMQNVELACSKTPMSSASSFLHVTVRIRPVVCFCRDVREGIPSWQQAAGSYFSHLSREKSLRPSSIGCVYLIYIDTQWHWQDKKKTLRNHFRQICLRHNILGRTKGAKASWNLGVDLHEPILHRSYTSQNVVWSSGHFSTYIARVLITVSVNLSCIYMALCQGDQYCATHGP